VFKKIYSNNPYKRIAREFAKDAKRLPKREVQFTRVRARSIMRKAPKKPKSRYGERVQYKRGKKKGQFYNRKGLYSKPGDPPFWHGDNSKAFNLRRIEYREVGTPHIKAARKKAGGKTISYVVGPKYRASRHSTPVPQLHEHGGSIRISRAGKKYSDRGFTFRRTVTTGTVNYPPRPYMQPAGKEARVSAIAKSPQSLKALVNLGGLKGRRIY
jgi:hypothetical protein